MLQTPKLTLRLEMIEEGQAQHLSEVSYCLYYIWFVAENINNINMSQYILNVKKSKQAEALMAYLRSLDFIELSALNTKSDAVAKATKFLKSLPDQSGKQADVNKAVKSIRKKYGYQ